MDKKEENLFTPDSIRTFTGQYVNVINPNPDTINIEDIAHSLANMPRFGGHLKHFYSVAEHSLLCMDYVADNLKLQALLHDASEAYLMDMPKPIKNHLPDYQIIEYKIQSVINKKFGLPIDLDKSIKVVDKKIIEFEWQKLMLDEGKLGDRTREDVERDFLLAFRMYEIVKKG